VRRNLPVAECHLQIRANELTRNISAYAEHGSFIGMNVEYDVVAKRERSIFITYIRLLLNSEFNEFRAVTSLSLSAQIDRNEGAV
jgi:hypothetical protein